MGSVHVTVTFEGRTAHSARPWQGDNAITKAAPFLMELGEREPNDVYRDGLLFREVISATMASAGRSRNIVPDRCEIEWFDGPHTINGQGTFDFLHKHLKWDKP